jgi:eukaryotic-like serine/threonine-protein kinase
LVRLATAKLNVPLSSGTRLGPYEILSAIGAGGMGEVYRARDLKLGRDIAIKILPPQFMTDRDRLVRFEREARILATLNHPNIAAIYGLEDPAALILELVEGQTLAERLSSCRDSGLGSRDSLEIARQVVDALAAAHEKGIIHRDLKPANIKITPAGQVKVLDFGLAKAMLIADADVSQSPTVTVEGTRAGMILGTAAYMSPEQARGKVVDARTDIWAFGCVLFEMLTGRTAFAKETMSDTIAAILERDPDWSALPRATPVKIRGLLRRCLDKDPTRRPQAIADVRSTIADASTVKKRPIIAATWIAAAVAFATIAIGVFWLTRAERSTLVDASKWIQLTAFPDSVTQPALSPDGRFVAFIHGPDTFTTPGQIYIKQLPNGEAVPLTNDELPKMSPVFSPDGTRIAYTVNGSSERWNTWIVPTLRGTPRRWLHNASGLTWVSDSDLLFSEIKSGSGQHMGIVRSNEARTASRGVYFPAHAEAMAHRSAVSPDGKWVLLIEMDDRSVWLPCRLVPADGAYAGHHVGPTNSRCTDVAWAPDGRFMYFSADAGDGFHLWRQRFPDGQAEQITRGPTSEEGIAIAADGRSLITSVGFRRRGIWIHDASAERPIAGEGYAFWPLFSADGTKLVYRISPRGSGGQTPVSGQSPTELWVMDLRSGSTERLLPGQLATMYDLSASGRIVATIVEADGKSRVWLAWLNGREPPRRVADIDADTARFAAGDAIVFRAADGDAFSLFRINADGTGRTKVAPFNVSSTLGNASPGGEWLSAFGGTGENRDLWLISTSGMNEPVLFLASGGVRRAGGRIRWSPDGRQAYFSIATTTASAFGLGRTYVIPLRAGSLLPDIPSGGFRSEGEIARLPGVEIIPYGDVVLGPTRGTYAFSRETMTRNLYRIPLP